MTLTLSKGTIQWLLEMQEKFDSKLRVDKGISDEEWHSELDDNHYIALSVEVGEFVNECIEIWKYWKEKPSKLDRILDEAIDVIHFIMLISNKVGGNISDVHKTLMDHCEVLEKEEGKEHATPKKLIKFMLNTDDVLMLLATMLRILDGYHFTEQDIIEQYKRKNAINFERLEEGY